MDARVRTFLVRSAFLFLISLVLVAGFWYHREFYQIGFTNLLIIGGFVTFLVIWAARLALSGELPRGRPRGADLLHRGRRPAPESGGARRRAAVGRNDRARRRPHRAGPVRHRPRVRAPLHRGREASLPRRSHRCRRAAGRVSNRGGTP